jgi:predicted Co/Zn/Cd cation transporter (cation efflux family)
MKKLLKTRVGRFVSGIVGGLIGGGGGVALGLDIDSALVIFGGVFVLIFAGEEAFVLWQETHNKND